MRILLVSLGFSATFAGTVLEVTCYPNSTPHPQFLGVSEFLRDQRCPHFTDGEAKLEGSQEIALGQRHTSSRFLWVKAPSRPPTVSLPAPSFHRLFSSSKVLSRQSPPPTKESHRDLEGSARPNI